MKDQYFGDSRDFFKFTVLECLASTLGHQLTCLWLLTAPDRTSQGRVAAHPEPANVLSRFLFERRMDPRGAGVSDMKHYFARSGIQFNSYRDDQQDFGRTDQQRQDYFANVEDKWLSKAVVFFDPDTGFEPARGGGHSHVRFAELATVLRRMDEDSLAVVYQHWTRPKGGGWANVAGRVTAGLAGQAVEREHVGYVADADVALFMIGRARLVQSATRSLRALGRRSGQDGSFKFEFGALTRVGSQATTPVPRGSGPDATGRVRHRL